MGVLSHHLLMSSVTAAVEGLTSAKRYREAHLPQPYTEEHLMRPTGPFCRSLSRMAPWPSMLMLRPSSTRAARSSSAGRWPLLFSRATSPPGTTQPLWLSTPTSRERARLPSKQRHNHPSPVDLLIWQGELDLEA